MSHIATAKTTEKTKVDFKAEIDFTALENATKEAKTINGRKRLTEGSDNYKAAIDALAVINTICKAAAAESQSLLETIHLSKTRPNNPKTGKPLKVSTIKGDKWINKITFKEVIAVETSEQTIKDRMKDLFDLRPDLVEEITKHQFKIDPDDLTATDAADLNLTVEERKSFSAPKATKT